MKALSAVPLHSPEMAFLETSFTRFTHSVHMVHSLSHCPSSSPARFPFVPDLGCLLFVGLKLWLPNTNFKNRLSFFPLSPYSRSRVWGSVRNPSSSPAQDVRVRQCGFFPLPSPRDWSVGVKVRSTELGETGLAAEWAQLRSSHQPSAPAPPRGSERERPLESRIFWLAHNAAQSKRII